MTKTSFSAQVSYSSHFHSAAMRPMPSSNAVYVVNVLVDVWGARNQYYIWGYGAVGKKPHLVMFSVTLRKWVHNCSYYRTAFQYQGHKQLREFVVVSKGILSWDVIRFRKSVPNDAMKREWVRCFISFQWQVYLANIKDPISCNYVLLSNTNYLTFRTCEHIFRN